MNYFTIIYTILTHSIESANIRKKMKTADGLKCFSCASESLFDNFTYCGAAFGVDSGGVVRVWYKVLPNVWQHILDLFFVINI